MTVWIVNPFDNLPSEGNRPQRYWLMARGFAADGHKVILWTSDFSHATKSKRRLVRECDDGFQVRLVPTMPYPKNICLKRILSHWRLAKDWLRLARAEKARPDVVIASTPPLGLCDAARSFAKSVGAMFVADIQDAWPETFERIFPRFMFSLLGLTRCAKRIYCYADGISAVARRYVDLAIKYGSDAPMLVFGHCMDMSHIQHRNSSPASGGVLRLAYVGNMSMSYDLKTVINAVARRDGVTLDVAGNGPDRQRLIRLAEGASNIKFHDYLGESALRDLLANCDVGLVPMFPDSCVGVPGKLADYAAAGLKIIESLGGETGELVAKYHAGFHYEAGNVRSLREAIVSCYNIKEPNDPAFANHFDANRIMAAYVHWVCILGLRKS